MAVTAVSQLPGTSADANVLAQVCFRSSQAFDGLLRTPRERHRQLEQFEGDFRRFASAIHQVV